MSIKIALVFFGSFIGTIIGGLVSLYLPPLFSQKLIKRIVEKEMKNGKACKPVCYPNTYKYLNADGKCVCDANLVIR